MDNKEQAPKHTTRLAMIGLIGTILTVCGGLTGAIIGGVTTIYKVNQENQHLSIAAPQSDQALAVNTRQIAINVSKVTKLDPAKFQSFTDLGFVAAKPQTGWDGGKQMTYYDLFLEEASNLSPLILFSKWVKDGWDDQPVYQVRYADPVMVEFIEGSTENGVAVDPTQLNYSSYKFYSRMIVLALDKSVVQKDFSLYDLALIWGELHQGGVNDLVANPDNQYVFEQVSWKLTNVKVNNRKIDLTLQRWGLFAEGPDRFYIIEMQYVPASNQSVQVFDDMQTYLNGFRVIQ
jgi:hypothetical protein